MKRLHTTHREDFDLEVKMLKAIRRHRHPHLVKLLATFQWRGEYYLLFPYAKANLREYWEQTPHPEFSSSMVLWTLNQCKGIASGLLRIHGYRDTLEYTLSAEQSPTRLTRGKTGIIDGRLYGRHGDIKPENILWTDEHLIDEHRGVRREGCLLIADFGLMDFHSAITRSKVRPNIAGTPAYEPPEPDLQSNISRAYDIWSLGRVYLEFITWLLGGKKELDRLSGVCGMNGINENDCDKFFTIVDDNLDGHRRRATVRESVKEWIEDLHKKPRCSDFIHEFLELIAGEMLVVDPHNRIHCGNLSERFSKMVLKAEENSNYLSEEEPRPPRTLVERTEQDSVAASGSDQEISSLSSKVGDPLLKSSTTANGSVTEAPRRLQIVPSATFFSESPPSSPKLVQGHNQAKWER
jgi:serine/threonine protein kinase